MVTSVQRCRVVGFENGEVVGEVVRVYASVQVNEVLLQGLVVDDVGVG